MIRDYKVFITKEQTGLLFQKLVEQMPTVSSPDTLNEYLMICNSLISLDPEKSLEICESLKPAIEQVVSAKGSSWIGVTSRK